MKISVKFLGKLEAFFFILCLSFIVIGIVVRIVAYFYNRSLFLDEAMLASSVVQRDYMGLFQPLDYNQGAPIGFLLIVKTFVYLFGTSEFVLRLLPLISGIGSIGIYFLILRDVFKDPRPWIGTAFYATIPYLIYYSIEFKPYMLDGFITLIIFYSFFSTMNGRLNPWVNILICSLLLWFSFPAIFSATACCTLMFIKAVKDNQTQDIKLSAITSMFIGASFLILFFTYYNNITANRGDPYWSLLYFPLIPSGKESFDLIFLMIKNYFSVFGTNRIFILLLSPVALGFIMASKARRWFGILFFIEVLILLSASWLKRYVMIDRLLIFIIPLHALLVTLIISELWSKWPRVALITSILLVSLNVTSFRYLLPRYVFRETMEINPILEMTNDLKGDAALYLSVLAVPQYQYKTEYKKTQEYFSDDTTKNIRVIFGTGYYSPKYNIPYSWETEIDSAKLMNEVCSITSYQKVYLIFVLCENFNRETLLNELKKSGSITEIMNYYETPLYCFSKAIKSEPFVKSRGYSN